MKSLYLAILFLAFGSAFGDDPGPRLRRIEREIEVIQAACIPKAGTTKASLEKAFGQGTPSGEALNRLPLIGELFPIDDHQLEYRVCKNGVLFVRYDKNWKVKNASYVDPFFAFSCREFEPGSLKQKKEFLKLMKTIKRQYIKKTGRP